MVNGSSKRFWFLTIVVSLVMSVCQVHARVSDIELVRKFLNQPDQQIDLGKVKLTIDRMIDSRIEVDNGLKQLDEIVAQVKSRLPLHASDRDKFDALRTYLYQAGPWNKYRPFEYDFNDPFGDNIKNKLLKIYLATRKGNCVSMPLLVIVLGQRLGINVTAAMAPEHLFVKFRDETGKWLNFEATNGTFARDEWIQHEAPMTPQALASGIYMQPLTKKETAVVMLSTLMEYYRQKGRHEDTIKLATLALEHYPKDISSILAIGAAYGQQRDRDCASMLTNPRDVPQAERRHCLQLNQAVGLWWSKAEALGWREPTAAANAEYLERVNRVKRP